MRIGIIAKLTLLATAFGLLSLPNQIAIADGARLVIDGKATRRVGQGAVPDKFLGTIFKRRDTVQTFLVTNRTGITWISVSAGIADVGIGSGAGSFSIRSQAPSTIQPFQRVQFIVGYEGGPVASATPPPPFPPPPFPLNGTIAFIQGINEANPLDGFFCYFYIEDTPKKRKGIYQGVTVATTIRDKSGTYRVPDTPIRLAMPLGRGTFNGEFMGRETNVFPANTTIQGRVNTAQYRQGGKKIIMSGKQRWRFNRNALPLGRAVGRFSRWEIRADKNGSPTLYGNFRISNTKVEDKSAKYIWSGRIKAPFAGGARP